MRALSPLLFSGLASAALLSPAIQPRAASKATIRSVTANGTLCPDDTTYTVHISPDEDVFTMGFINNWVATDQPSTSGGCKLSVQMNYPPGCTTANLSATASGFMDGDETVQGLLNIDYVSPGGRRGNLIRETEVNWHWSLTNPGIVWLHSAKINGNMEVKNQEGVDVTVELDTSILVEIVQDDSVGGKFEFEQITMNITDVEWDDDWRGCT